MNCQKSLSMWTAGSGVLTEALKLKRRRIKEKYEKISFATNFEIQIFDQSRTRKCVVLGMHPSLISIEEYLSAY
uniref:Uncharacterized protein n=1 Tax=Elaeophora elaphi TaxID=1147741 RepID=A0A0R3RX67_9BILA